MIAKSAKSGDITIVKSLLQVYNWGNGEAIQRSSDCVESHV